MAISTDLNRKVWSFGLSLRAFALAGLVASAPINAFAVDCDTDGSTCNDAQQTAQTACNSQDLQAGMTAAQMAQAQALTAQANAANQATTTTGSSTSAQCENQAALSGILSALSALKATACKSAASDCNDTCENLAQNCDVKAAAIPAKAAEYKAHATAARSKMKMCSAYGGNSTLAMVQAAALMASMFMNNSCAASTSSATPTPIDCTNAAYAAVTTACVCAPVGSNAYANPESSLCVSGSVTGTAANLSGSGAITPVSTDTTTDGTATGTVSGKGEPGTQAMTGGGGGGGMSGGSGGGGAGTGGGGGAEPSSIDKSVIQGQSAGGGGGLAVGAAGAGGAGESGGKKGDDGKIDLSQWLPKGKYKALNIGGMSIKADDGITGPMGPSLWEKVSNQYQQQKPTFIPER